MEIVRPAYQIKKKIFLTDTICFVKLQTSSSFLASLVSYIIFISVSQFSQFFWNVRSFHKNTKKQVKLIETPEKSFKRKTSKLACRVQLIQAKSSTVIPATISG